MITRAQAKEHEDEVALAAWWGDFAALERLYQRALEPGPRVEDGSALLSHFLDGVNRVFTQNDSRPPGYYREIEALALGWTQQHPQSALAHLLYAKALLAHGWSYRGTGFARDVPPQAWEDFRRYVAQAAEHLTRHAEVALQPGLGYQTFLSVAGAMDWDKPRLMTVLEAAVRREPDNERPYFTALNYMLPKWGGSPALVERVVQMAVRNSQAQWGQSYYAVLYAYVARYEFGHRLFQDSMATWPRMKAGFEDLLRRYPSARRHNQFAYFACMAQDRATFLEQVDKIGPEPELRNWGQNARRTFETCQRWGAQS